VSGIQQIHLAVSGFGQLSPKAAHICH